MNKALLLQLLSDDQPRRIRVIENLLVGKRTVSTLYWGLRYDLLAWFGFEKHLARRDVANALNQLVADGSATVANLVAQLTPTGAIQKHQLAKVTYQPVALSSWLTVARPEAWQGLQLAVQVVSEFQAANRQYYPLQVAFETRQTVKRWFLAQRRPTLAKQVRGELGQFLSAIPEPVADLWASLLVGHQTPGKTVEQLFEMTHRSALELTVIQDDIMTQLVLVTQAAPTSFPVLHELLQAWQVSPISPSAAQTLANYRAGATLSTIVEHRRLKPSTVHEHLLEAAIFLSVQQFPYAKLLPNDLQRAFAQRLTGSIDDWAFDQVSDLKIEFWQFRLYEIMRSKLSDDGDDSTTL